MEILRKITVKTAGGWTIAKIKEAMTAAKLEEGQSVALSKIVGKTTGVKTGQTDKGEFFKLSGDFYATNLHTGEVYQSGACILPNFIAETLVSALAQSPSVEFGVEIGVKRADNAITGYEYTVKPLVQAKPTDTMMALLAAAGIDPASQTKALPAAAAPAADPAPAPAAASAAAPADDKGKGKGK